MTRAAQKFVNSLTDKQREQAVFGFGSSDKRVWTYVPGQRKGVSWGELTEPQQRLGRELLHASLSQEGYDKIEAIRSLEPILGALEGGNKDRDPIRYWFVFYGTPDPEAPWLWRYEGHHVSLSFANRGGALVASTPQFLGSNPAKVPSGPRSGERVLAREQDLGFRLVESFSAVQLSAAVVSKDAPTDIMTNSSRKAAIEGHAGIAFGDLKAEQQTMLKELVALHAEVQTKEERKRRLTKVEDEGYGSVVFAWMGPISRTGRHYYRIQGKSFVIEYDNTQADGNHIHTVWRDFDGDFGEDPLAEHYAHDHGHGE